MCASPKDGHRQKKLNMWVVEKISADINATARAVVGKKRRDTTALAQGKKNKWKNLRTRGLHRNTKIRTTVATRKLAVSFEGQTREEEDAKRNFLRIYKGKTINGAQVGEHPTGRDVLVRRDEKCRAGDGRGEKDRGSQRGFLHRKNTHERQVRKKKEKKTKGKRLINGNVDG